MASKTQIATRALAKLGQPRVSNIDTDDSKSARVIRDMYDSVLAALLSEYPWSFALRRKRLAKNAVAPDWGFANSYTLPSDFLSLLEVRNNPIYKIESDSDGDLAILTNDGSPIYILYISLVTDTGSFGPLFAEAFAARLAMEACEQILESNTKKQILIQEYREIMGNAFVSDAIQDQPQELELDEWSMARTSSLYNSINYNNSGS